MPVQSDDINVYLTGGINNSSGSQSLGGNASNTLVSNELGSLFASIGAVNHSASSVYTEKKYDYRVLAVKIKSPLTDSSLSTLTNGKLKINTSNLGDCNIKVFVAEEANQIVQLVDSPYTKPSLNGPITFQAIPNSGLNLPTPLNPGDEVHFILQRGVNAGITELDPTSITFEIEGNTV